MMRIIAFVTIVCLATACGPVATGEPSPAQPNIILIYADDLGYGDLSCYGHPTIHTPRIDQLATEGIKLTSFYTAAAVCTPSRAGLLTGRYPLRVGLPGNLGPDSEGGLNREERTLAEGLRDNGYRTAAFGKWHLGAVPGYLPTDRGFDEYFGILYSNDMMPPWVNTERPLHLYRNDQPTTELPVNQTTLTQRYTDEAIRVINQQDDQPFFIYLPYAMPHLPLNASDAFRGKSAGGLYGDVIEEIDHNVGRLLDALATSSAAENTLVIFTSDNGPWRNLPNRMIDSEPVEAWHGGSTGPLSGAKATTMEGGARVPAIMHWPGKIPAGQVSAELATTLDLHATILAITNTPVPSRPLDGQNLWPFLTGTAPSPVAQYFYFTGRRLDGVRDAEWKLRIAPVADDWKSPEHATGEEPVEVALYNLKNDPFEQFNLAEQFPEEVARLKKSLATMASATGATLVNSSEIR